MAKSIYVGNLPWSATEEQVQSLFADYGPVVSVKLVSDRETPGPASSALLVWLESSAPRCPHRGAFFMPGPIGKASRREPGQAAETCVLWKAGAPFYTASR